MRDRRITAVPASFLPHTRVYFFFFAFLRARAASCCFILFSVAFLLSLFFPPSLPISFTSLSESLLRAGVAALCAKLTYYSTECAMAHIGRKPVRQFFLHAPLSILCEGWFHIQSCRIHWCDSQFSDLEYVRPMRLTASKEALPSACGRSSHFPRHSDEGRPDCSARAASGPPAGDPTCGRDQEPGSRNRPRPPR